MRVLSVIILVDAVQSNLHLRTPACCVGRREDPSFSFVRAEEFFKECQERVRELKKRVLEDTAEKKNMSRRWDGEAAQAVT